MGEIILYNSELDEDCYRVRLMLSLLKREHRVVAVDMLPGREHLKSPYIEMNPAGALPILSDDGRILTGTGAILAYLARAYDAGGTWLPAEPWAFGETMRWLDFALTTLQAATAARKAALFEPAGGDAGLTAKARAALRIMDDHIIRQGFAGLDWFAGADPTIADVALFPGFALSRDIGLHHGEFPGLRAWYRRFRALDGFRVMPGIPDYY